MFGTKEAEMTEKTSPNFFSSLLSGFSELRKRVNNPNPGTFDSLHREVKNTFLTNHLFDGARADLTKILSPNFQVTHSFSLGSVVAPPQYNFGSIFLGTNSLLQGTVDNDGNVTARVNYAWNQKNTTKIQAQISGQPGHSMLQVEHDHLGSDYSVSLKAVNPSPAESTGIYLLSYLQSITPRLALGVETVYQRPTSEVEETLTSVVAKYTGDNCVATVQAQGMGALHASYYHKLGEKVDVGTEIQLLSAGGRRDGVTTFGALYQFRQSSVRAQIDTTGRVSAVIEERMAPGFSFLVSGDLDHVKGNAKFGVGIMIEA
ncbi:uncharacterized protein VTP21DRAFT_532 [Calcarisporiella thermophila]|uniref:uncharacterized protein n=1 Tax=Calcarisporiella thermophila TaxID=911321 RepID=UPI003744162A